MMDKLRYLEQWRICGVFAPAAERQELLDYLSHHLQRTAGGEIIRLAARRNRSQGVYALEDMSTRRSNQLLDVIRSLTPQSVLVLDDIETIRNYPQSMTRNIINHLAKRTRYKLIGGSDLVVSALADLYAPFAVLDKRIIHANHYWCFAEDHREVSVFDGRTVMPNKDQQYLALKLKPFIYFDLQPEGPVQEQLYQALRQAPIIERVQDISDLRL